MSNQAKSSQNLNANTTPAQDPQRKQVQTQQNADIYNTQASSKSPSRIQGPTARIAKRQLWWKEAPSEKKIPSSKPFKPNVPASARIDNDNRQFQPAAYNGAKIETKKLVWSGSSVVDTWGNVNHQPGGLYKPFFLVVAISS
jgi:hypothetical protein